MNPWMLFKRGLMTFWYWYVRKLNAAWPSITLQGKTLTILPGVYKPVENEQACVAYCREGDRVLDLGCGSGVCTVFCAERAREVVAIDISPAAVRNTEENCRRHGLTHVTVRHSDMFSNVEGKFDLILSNPPYIAADFKDEEAQFATSTRYLPVLFADVHNHLAKDGRLLVQFPMWFRSSIRRLAATHGLQVVSVKRMPRKPLGLLLTSLLYLQFGFRSAIYEIRPLPAVGSTAAEPAATVAAVL
ncbi:MAG TPA: methyltransferase [Alphaproteobacteria bacterium]|nr:methyltransferase [Alphaproteobacteria bacterium]